MAAVKEVMFMFSQLNPLDNVPLDSIVSVHVVGNNLIFNTLDAEGAKVPLHKHRTPFIVNQIKGFDIQTYGEEL